MFADDLKAFVENIDEIATIESVIGEFEIVSGVILHRDPKREKCQPLPFGQHKGYGGWDKYPWITPKQTIKVVGAHFSNTEDLDKINMELALKNFYLELHRSFGIRGTIQQKVYLCNTYLFSKVWFLSQCFLMHEKEMDNGYDIKESS